MIERQPSKRKTLFYSLSLTVSFVSFLALAHTLFLFVSFSHTYTYARTHVRTHEHTHTHTPLQDMHSLNLFYLYTER